MERSEVIFLAGLIVAIIWMGACVVIEGKNRKYVIMTGLLIDIVLFIICRNADMLLMGFLGGLACGLIPGLGGSTWKYERAVKEMNGVKNWVVVSIIFFVMLMMTIVIAHPEIKFVYF